MKVVPFCAAQGSGPGGSKIVFLWCHVHAYGNGGAVISIAGCLCGSQGLREKQPNNKDSMETSSPVAGFEASNSCSSFRDNSEVCHC